MRYQLTPIRMTIRKKKKTQKIISVGDDVENMGLLCTVDGNGKWYDHYGKQYDGSSKN